MIFCDHVLNINILGKASDVVYLYGVSVICNLYITSFKGTSRLNWVFLCQITLTIVICPVMHRNMVICRYVYLFTLRSQEGRCDSVSDGNILFDETRMGRLYQYKYLAVNRTICLGVLNDCNYNLALISTTNDKTDGRCLFKKHRSKLSATKRRPSFFIKK